MLRRVPDDASEKPAGTADSVKNNTGKLLQQTMLLSNLILPAHIEEKSRGKLLTIEALGQDQRVDGSDVMRLQNHTIESLRERESEIFLLLITDSELIVVNTYTSKLTAEHIRYRTKHHSNTRISSLCYQGTPL